MIEFYLTQIILWTITIISAFLAYEFYTSKNGRLRILMIRLFSCKVFLYGGFAITLLFAHPISMVWVRFVLNFPMFLVMLQLYKFIRNKD